MDIGKVAKISKLPASTIRFYEEKGLIKSIGRTGLRRDFSPNVIEKLSLISLGRYAGLSLDEIKPMIDSQGLDINRELLTSKADELDKKIKEMKVVRDTLNHAAACNAPNHMECPQFLRLLNIASKNRYRPKHQL